MSAVRRSIEERYGTHEKYVAQVRDAVDWCVGGTFYRTMQTA